MLRTAAATAVLALSGPALAHDPDHRDDLHMNSVGGGDYRDYVTDHASEQSGWSYSLRTVGTAHNVMHQMMSDYARHDREERGGSAVPEFGARISGGDWTEYREALEAEAAEGEWADLVRITEVMHDRFHHMMFKAIIYDDARNERGAALDGYLRPRVEAQGDDLIPARRDLDIDHMSLEDFRGVMWETGWTNEAGETWWRLSMQDSTVFAHLLSDLTRQWMVYGAAEKSGDCAPQNGDGYDVDAAWRRFAIQVRACEEAEWRELVQVTDLARARVHEMLAYVAAYHDARD